MKRGVRSYPATTMSDMAVLKAECSRTRCCNHEQTFWTYSALLCRKKLSEAGERTQTEISTVFEG